MQFKNYYHLSIKESNHLQIINYKTFASVYFKNTKQYYWSLTNNLILNISSYKKHSLKTSLSSNLHQPSTFLKGQNTHPHPVHVFINQFKGVFLILLFSEITFSKIQGFVNCIMQALFSQIFKFLFSLSYSNSVKNQMQSTNMPTILQRAFELRLILHFVNLCKCCCSFVHCVQLCDLPPPRYILQQI